MNQEYIEFLLQKETKDMLIGLKNETQSDCSSEYVTNNNIKNKSSQYKSQMSYDSKVPDSAILNHKQHQGDFKAQSSKFVRDLIKNDKQNGIN